MLETARQHRNRIGRVYAGRNGINGALTEDLIDTGRESAAALSGLTRTPGGAFGSCRYMLKSPELNPLQYQRLIDVFRTVSRAAHDLVVQTSQRVTPLPITQLPVGRRA